ncbi:MAG: ABC transporter permease [Proteobacteria bacterium]|nr:ABC transporter permease [Pseudomonadota bacterium]
MDAIRLYFSMIAVSIRGQMQYRAAFLMQTVGQFFITAADFLGIWILFQRFDNLKGWRLEEVALLYGIVCSAFAVAEAASHGFDFFSETVKRGNFDRLLLRPRSTALQLAGQQLTLRRVGKLLQSLMVLTWAIWMLQIDWSLPKMMLLVGTILGGICVFYGLFILQATLAFWTTESLEIVNIVTYGGTETAQYPISIYRGWLRRFFTFIVPIAAVNYFPALAILEKPDPLNVPVVVQWISPLFSLLFILVVLRLWRFGERHYCSTGS